MSSKWVFCFLSVKPIILTRETCEEIEPQREYAPIGVVLKPINNIQSDARIIHRHNQI